MLTRFSLKFLVFKWGERLFNLTLVHPADSYVHPHAVSLRHPADSSPSRRRSDSGPRVGYVKWAPSSTTTTPRHFPIVSTTYEIPQAHTLLVLLSLIPNNSIRYTLLGLGASISVFYGPTSNFRLSASSILSEAKSLCERGRHNLTEEEMPGVHWTSAGVKNYRQCCRDIHQCEKEIKKIRVEVKRKYTGDIDENEAIVTAALGTIAYSHRVGEQYSLNQYRSPSCHVQPVWWGSSLPPQCFREL
ncbi:hypothetical protein C8R44DRAFT_723532 [Mycena epipterygia]|nr:hypothetical protein C8R44DRAFT_723532 [Mycena epipterygia]